jgi:hypothetical protein
MTADEEDDELTSLQRGLDRLRQRLGPDPAAKLRAELQGLRALKVTRPWALDPLCESLVALATKALADGHTEEAAEALEGLLDVVPAAHAKRAEVQAFAVRVRAMASGRRQGDRAPRPAEVVDPAMAAGYLLMAAQDGELTPEEAATLEERLGPADAALRVEWGWLEKARGALGRVATFEPADDDPLWARSKASVRDGLDRPAPVDQADDAELDRLRHDLQRRDSELRSLLDGITGVLAVTQAPLAGDGGSVGRRLLDVQAKLSGQLRRFLGRLGEDDRKGFELAGEAAALLAASKGEPRRGPPPQPVRTSRVVGSLEVATSQLPAAEPYGDLVDVSDRPGGVDVVLLEASGRGLRAQGAALAARVGVQTALAVGATPSAAFAATNQALCRVDPLDMFVAGTHIRWDEARGVALLTGAGGETAIVRRARRGAPLQVERLKPGGVVLGAVREAPPFPTREVELAPGDLLLLVSDGVTEQPGPDGTPYCDERWTRLLALLTKFGHLEAAAFVVTLEAELRAWGSFSEGGPRDDVVIVALRRR